MLEALRFVQGGVARKDFLPELEYFFITNGRITGFNGTMAVSSPIPMDVTCSPKATALVKAVQACTAEAATLHLTPTGKLSIRSGKFRALVECLATPTPPPVNMTGDKIPLPADFVKALRKIKPFISEDASRTWSKGVLVRNGCLYATNNVALIQLWMDMGGCPEINIPEMVVNELLRLKQDPVYMRVNDTAVTFFFDNDRWLSSTLYSAQWPDIDHILDLPHDNPKPVDDPLRDALLTLKPFLAADMRVFSDDTGLATHGEDDTGAQVALDAPYGRGCFNHTHLSIVAEVAETLDISAYPAPATFRGKMLRGSLAGMVL